MTKGQVLINKSVEDLINQEDNTTQTWTKDMNKLLSEEEPWMVSKQKGKKGWAAS